MSVLSLSQLQGVSGTTSNIQNMFSIRRNSFRQSLGHFGEYSCEMEKIFKNMNLWEKIVLPAGFRMREFFDFLYFV